MNFLLVLKRNNTSSRPKNWCSDEFPKHSRANVDHMPRLECLYTGTPCTPPTGPHALPHKHTSFCRPFNSGLRQDHGRLNPRLQTPFPCPLPLTPSAKDHCLLSLSSTVLLVWWGPAESLHYCLAHHCNPPSLTDPAWPHSQYSKAPSVSPNSQGVRDRKEEGRKHSREKGDVGLGGRRGKDSENKRHLLACWAVCREVSVK